MSESSTGSGLCDALNAMSGTIECLRCGCTVYYAKTFEENYWYNKEFTYYLKREQQ